MSVGIGGGAPGDHVGEMAELYALGALEPNERAEVEAHVAACAACSRALGAASSSVAALEDATTTPLDPPERLAFRIARSARAAQALAPDSRRRRTASAPSVLATAAAFFLAVGLGIGAIVERSQDAAQASRESTVLAAIATSHFLHVSLSARDSGIAPGKVLYARDGAWVYVILTSAACECRAVVRSGQGDRDLGRLEGRGTTATLFARPNVPPTSLDLVDDAGRVVATATLAYPKATPAR
jgi:hypothetical protein